MGGGFMAAPHDLAREIGMLLGRGANHERGRLDAVPVEQVEEPRNAFDRAVLEPGIGGKIEKAVRHRAVERVGSMQVLPAGLQHRRREAETAMRAPFGQNGVAAPPAAGCGTGWDAETWAEADFAAKAAALARPSPSEDIASGAHGAFLSFAGFVGEGRLG